RYNGHHHQGDFDKVENKAEQEHHQHHNQHGGKDAAGQAVEEILNHFFAAETTEYQREQRGTNKDHKYHAGHLQGGIQHFAQPLNAELAVQYGQQQGAGRTNASGFGRRGDAGQNRAEHSNNQNQRRQQAAQQFQHKGAVTRRSVRYLASVLGSPQRDGRHIEPIGREQQQAGNPLTDEQGGHRDAVGAENPLLQLSLLVSAGQHIAQNNQ